MKPQELAKHLLCFPDDTEIVVSSAWLSSLHQGFVEPPVQDYALDKSRHRLAYRATESYGKGERVLFFLSEAERADWLEWKPKQTPSATCKADPESPVSIYILD
jgi:hypothetical protein